MITADVNMSGLNETLKTLELALIGTGGDAQSVVRDEARRLAEEISLHARPKDRKATQGRIDKSVRNTFAELNEKTDYGHHQGKRGSGDVKWYAWDKDYLYGVSKNLNLRKAPVSTLASVYFAAKTVKGKKRLLVPFAKPRKHQMKAILTRVAASKSGIRAVSKLVAESIGKLPASWLATAKKIDPNAHGPAWIERHIKGGKSSKSITDLTQLGSPDKPAVTFGSHAEGVQKFNRVIQYAVNLREKKMHARISLILSGYAEDVAHGIRVKRHASNIKAKP